MSSDLLLKPLCRHCRSTKDLYGSNCRHMTLCMSCGKQMAEKRLGCVDCGVPVTRLIREYNVRPCSTSDKNYFIGRFVSGLPQFSKKQNSENKWSLQKEGLQGRQQTDALREKYKNKPWLLEEETGQFQYSGHMEGAQSATYYLLMPQGKDFSAIPASSWYNFNKVAQYKQLTLEEAEEKMKNRRKTADGYQRWMMKAANNGPAAFGEVEKFDDKETGGGGGRGRKKSIADDDSNVSDRGEEDEEEEAGRKNRLKLKSGAGDDDEEGLRGGDLDFDDDNIEKGDDWEHEEIFTDDDEALGNDAEEREDLAPEIPPPPEIKQDEEDEDDDTNDEEGRLSKSGKELQKLLGRSNGESESDAEDDDEDDDDDSSPVLAPKKKDALKEEPGDNSPSKPFSSGSARGTPTSSKSTKGKRKTNGDDAKAISSTPPKKVKTENEVKSIKDETGSTSKSTVAAKDTPSQSSGPSTAEPATPVTEDEIRAVLLPNTSMTTQDLVSRFKSRLRTKEDKNKFTVALKNIGRINKTNGVNYVVLKR